MGPDAARGFVERALGEDLRAADLGGCGGRSRRRCSRKITGDAPARQNTPSSKPWDPAQKDVPRELKWDGGKRRAAKDKTIKAAELRAARAALKQMGMEMCADCQSAS